MQNFQHFSERPQECKKNKKAARESKLQILWQVYKETNNTPNFRIGYCDIRILWYFWVFRLSKIYNTWLLYKTLHLPVSQLQISTKKRLPKLLLLFSRAEKGLKTARQPEDFDILDRVRNVIFFVFCSFSLQILTGSGPADWRLWKISEWGLNSFLGDALNYLNPLQELQNKQEN